MWSAKNWGDFFLFVLPTNAVEVFIWYILIIFVFIVLNYISLKSGQICSVQIPNLSLYLCLCICTEKIERIPHHLSFLFVHLSPLFVIWLHFFGLCFFIKIHFSFEAPLLFFNVDEAMGRDKVIRPYFKCSF